MLANDGVWLGTFINLDRDYRRGGLINRQSEIRQSHLALWGEADTIIPRQTVQRLASEMPNCQSRFCPGVGHSMLQWRMRPCQMT
jgi:pimeloyl-ACP methyl ester carboxylesterase